MLARGSGAIRTRSRGSDARLDACEPASGAIQQSTAATWHQRGITIVVRCRSVPRSPRVGSRWHASNRTGGPGRSGSRDSPQRGRDVWSDAGADPRLRRPIWCIGAWPRRCRWTGAQPRRRSGRRIRRSHLESRHRSPDSDPVESTTVTCAFGAVRARVTTTALSFPPSPRTSTRHPPAEPNRLHTT